MALSDFRNRLYLRVFTYREVAGDPVAWAQLAPFGFVAFAYILRELAACVELAARGRVYRAGDVALDHLQFLF